MNGIGVSPHARMMDFVAALGLSGVGRPLPTLEAELAAVFDVDVAL